MADIPLDFGTLEKYGCFVGSHAVVILSDSDDMKAVALNLIRFFEDESCGQCTPCRVGTEKAAQLMANGPWDPGLLDEFSALMRDASICGLARRPQSAALRAKILPREPEKTARELVMRFVLLSPRESGGHNHRGCDPPRGAWPAVSLRMAGRPLRDRPAMTDARR